MPNSNDEKKEQILEAVIAWEELHPFQEPQLTQLAAMVGISVRTLSRYFPNKEDMLGLAAMRYMMRTSDGQAELLMSAKTADCTAAEQIRSYFCTQRSIFHKNPELIRLYAVGNMRCIDYALRHQIAIDRPSKGIKKAIFDSLEAGKRDGSIREDIDTAMTIELIQTGFNGIMHQIAMTYTSLPSEQQKEEAEQLYKEFLKMLEWYVLPK